MNDWLAKMMQEKEFAPQGYNIHDLVELAHTNPAVNAIWNFWLKGHGGTFEQSLIRMVIELAAQNKNLTEIAIRADLLMPRTFTIPE